ncbi:unnamed protein product, partial [Rotaria sp. Silwood1]
MCDRHLFIIIIPNDWTVIVNHDNNKLKKHSYSNELMDDKTSQINRVTSEIVESIPSVSTSLCQLLQHTILDKYGLNE